MVSVGAVGSWTVSFPWSGVFRSCTICGGGCARMLGEAGLVMVASFLAATAAAVRAIRSSMMSTVSPPKAHLGVDPGAHLHTEFFLSDCFLHPGLDDVFVPP